MAYLALNLCGEIWAAYPYGMPFPKMFWRNYPMRGAGKVSKILYVLNRLGLDRILLKKMDRVVDARFNIDDNIAYFWPSSTRSRGRFYGYRVKDGKVLSYLKFATTSDERTRLLREAENVAIARKIPNRRFMVPNCRVVLMQSDCAILEFESLAEDACVVPSTESGLRLVLDAGKQIAAAGYQHGDFSWQNFRMDKGRLWILDWEEMSATLPMLVDEITCRMVFARYNLGKSMDDVWHVFEKTFLSGGYEKKHVYEAVRSMAKRKTAMGKWLWDRLYKEFLTK